MNIPEPKPDSRRMKNRPMVVVPWDFSDYSAEALHYSLEIAPLEDLRVICILEEPGAYAAPSLIEYDKEAAEANCRKEFRKIAGSALETVDFTIRFGVPSREIVDFARSVNAGMLVLATHGRTGVKRFMLGSVAEDVLRKAECPVVVLPREWVENRLHSRNAAETPVLAAAGSKEQEHTS